jgi:hypothetical protein
MSETELIDLAEAQRHFALLTNQRVWELLAKNERTLQEEDELLYAAFASCYHWGQIGTSVEQQRGEYLVAKAYMSRDNPAEALAHALKCRQLTEQNAEVMQDFDVAFAYELLARVYAMRGELDMAGQFYRLAQSAGAVIQDAEDKAIFDADFAAEPWFGLRRD